MSPKNAQPVRLYTKATFTGFKRAMRNQNNKIALLKIEGVVSKEDTSFYLGKRVAYIYRAHTEKNGSKYRCVWGKIRRAHGSNGAVRATFRRNMPAAAMGATVRVMLYPSRV